MDFCGYGISLFTFRFEKERVILTYWDGGGGPGGLPPENFVNLNGPNYCFKLLLRV